MLKYFHFKLVIIYRLSPVCLWLSRKGNWEASDKPDREWFKDPFILWRDPLFNVDGHAIPGYIGMKDGKEETVLVSFQTQIRNKDSVRK